MIEPLAMLWFDNSNTALPEKIRKAVIYYTAKYNLPANLCKLPAAEGLPVYVDEVRIVGVRDVLPNHLVISFEEPSAPLSSDTLLTRPEGRDGPQGSSDAKQLDLFD